MTDAEFIGLSEGKIHLHKLNGVKIAVPVRKLSAEDVEYVEQESGLSMATEKEWAREEDVITATSDV